MRQPSDPARHPWALRRRATAGAIALALALTAAGLPGARGGDKKDDKKPEPRPEPKVGYALNQIMGFGVQLADKDGVRQPITFDPQFGTSLTFVKIDGKMYLFGVKEDAKLPPGLHGGRWDPMKAALGKGSDGKERLGHKSTWVAGDHVRITQTVEIVPSDKGVLDAVLITYAIENKDEKPRKVAVRALVDTLIVDNDGHPFVVPGQAQLITTSADFKGKDVPAVIQALQRPDLKDPGLIASFSLKVGRGIEPPDRVSLTGLSNDPEDILSWEVPVSSIKDANKGKGDAAVILYWDSRELKGGGRRTVGYAYGGGVLSAAAGKQKEKQAKDKAP